MTTGGRAPPTCGRQSTSHGKTQLPQQIQTMQNIQRNRYNHGIWARLLASAMLPGCGDAGSDTALAVINEPARQTINEPAR
jgi:hypothetical protein